MPGFGREGQLAEHVEHLAAQRLARLFELVQQRAVDIALAGVVGDQIPQVADFGLADAMDAAKTLFEPVGVPGQVVIDHQVGALEIDALAGGVGGQQHPHTRIVLEGFLNLQALLAADAAVDDDDGVRAAEEAGDAVVQIIERVAVLGEDDQLLMRRGLRRRDRAGAMGCEGFRGAIGPRQARRGEDFAEQAGEFGPLGIGAAAAHGERLGFERLERFDLAAQFGDGARRGGLVEDVLLGGGGFLVRGVLEVVEIIGGQAGRGDRRRLPGPL